MITARHIGIASVAGLALGTAISVSPAGAAAIAALGGLIWWAACPLHGVERRWVIGWLTLAAASRVAVVAALPLIANPSQQSFATLFGGDASYMIQRSIWIANAFGHAPFAPRDLFEAFETTYGWSGYTYALALLHVFFGPSPYATHLMSAVLFFAAVAVLFGCVRSSYGPIAAFGGVALLTTMPSLFVWSVAPLKEAPFYILAAVAVRAMLLLLRPGRLWHIPVAAASIPAALWTIHIVRPQSALFTGAALAAGAAGWIAFQHRRIAACATVAGVTLALAIGAAPRAGAFIADALATATNRHMGNVSVQGHSYALLDPGAYAFGGELTSGPRSVARFVVRAPVRFFTVPEPWLLKPGFELLMVPQQMVWYAVLVLAGAGVLVGLRRDSLLTSVFASFVLVGAVAIGLNSGNVGTLIRHRDAVVPFAIWLSALGGTRVLGSGSRRFNTLDAAVAAVPIVLIPAGYALYLLFHMPPPRPESVTPAVIYAPSTVVLHGRNLRPFLHALVAPTGQEPETRDRHPRSPEAVYALRTAKEAELTLPAVPPGQYDVALFDGADEVARLSHAFTVSRMAEYPVGVVIAQGRFTRVDPATTTVEVGDSIKSSDGTTVVEVLQLGPDEPDIEWIGPGLIKTWARLDRYVHRPATLRLRCTFAEVRCYFAQQPVVADGVLMLPFLPQALPFIVDAVRPDASAWAMPDGPTSDAVVDFIGWPGAQHWIHPGDRDAGAPHARSLRPARIVRLIGTEPFVGEAALDSPLAERFALQAPLVLVRAVVRFPRLPSGDLDARNVPVRPGSRVDFETPTYLLHGTIVSVSADGAQKP